MISAENAVSGRGHASTMTFEIQVKVRGQLAQQGESASGRPLAKGACPGVGWTGARPKRGRWLDRARDPRRPENPRLPHVGSSPGKAGTPGGGEAVPGPAERPLPPRGEAGAEASAEAASPALLGDLGAPCARLRPEGEGGACACAVCGRPAASQTPTRPRPPGAGRVTPALETELLPGRRWGPTDACGDPPLPSKQPLRFPGRIWFAAEGKRAGRGVPGGPQGDAPPPPHSPGDPMTWSPDAHTERHGACGGGGARGAAKPPTPTHSAQDARNGSRDESQARTPLRMARGP